MYNLHINTYLLNILNNILLWYLMIYLSHYTKKYVITIAKRWLFCKNDPSLKIIIIIFSNKF